MAITTRNPKTQQFFDQGLAQMHSFGLVEAERSFLQGAEDDPAAPMPWWGIAMVSAGDYRPRFQMDRLEESYGVDPKHTSTSRSIEAARKALRLSSMPGNATALEKLYIASVVARRLPKTGDPNDLYTRALRALLSQYPHEVEARTYLALHLMRGFTLPERTPRPGSDEAVDILRTLLREVPNHPGARHYFIHAVEGSRSAKDAWASCERYPELVSAIPHALHMPGHIYFQTGRFDEAVKAFQAAASVELAMIRLDSRRPTGHYGHNMRFLSAAYGYSGKYTQAVQTARSILEFKESPAEGSLADYDQSAYRQGWFALMSALVLSENWDAILEESLPIYNRPKEQAWRHWSRALAQSAKGHANLARNEARLMEVALREHEVIINRKPDDTLIVARRELEAHILAADGAVNPAMLAFHDAMESQRQLTYGEPPRYPHAIAEVLGEYALKKGLLLEAEAAFRIALQDLPGSARAASGINLINQQRLQSSKDHGVHVP